MNNQSIGKKGEKIAQEFLIQKGFKIIETNYQKRSGEIDIIAKDPKYNEYVFIEVKTRQNLSFGFPEEAVGEDKISKIIETAEQWFEEKNIPSPEWRVDIISINWSEKNPKIEHIENIS